MGYTYIDRCRCIKRCRILAMQYASSRDPGVLTIIIGRCKSRCPLSHDIRRFRLVRATTLQRHPTQWRLANTESWYSLITIGNYSSVLPNARLVSESFDCCVVLNRCDRPALQHNDCAASFHLYTPRAGDALDELNWDLGIWPDACSSAEFGACASAPANHKLY